MKDLKERFTRIYLKKAKMTATKKEIAKHRFLWWMNLMPKESGGLRLTEDGFNFIKNIAPKMYEITISCELSARALLTADANIESPYYIKGNTIFVFSADTAVYLRICGGDLRLVGRSPVEFGSPVAGHLTRRFTK